MSTKTLTARFRSIGPIASWEMTLPGPGLHLLMGPPESGKSTIERALTLASMDRPAKRDADPARGGELVPFGALSGSTKDAAAMGLILAHAGEPDPSRYLVMLLPQEVADGMISEQLAGLSQLAQERGVYIVGGKVADGELRIATVE